MRSATFDLRGNEPLTPTEVRALLLARTCGPVNLRLEPGTPAARKLAVLFPRMLHEVRPGVWRLEGPKT